MEDAGAQLAGLIAGIIAWWIIFAIASSIISHYKGRGWFAGLLWGGLLGPFGLLVVLVQPRGGVPCPSCASPVNPKAKVCPTCRRDIQPPSPA
jgi:hypothetical protein